MTIKHARSIPWSAANGPLKASCNGGRRSASYGRSFWATATTETFRMRGHTPHPVQHIRRCYGSKSRATPRVAARDSTGGISKAAEYVLVQARPGECFRPSSQHCSFSHDTSPKNISRNSASGIASQHVVERSLNPSPVEYHNEGYRTIRSKNYLSHESRQKLGLKQSFCFRIPEAAKSSTRLEQYLNDIRELFTSCVDASTRKGLSCWAEALVQCSKLTSPIGPISIRPHRLTPIVMRLDSGRRSSQPYYVYGLVTDGTPILTMSLPHMFTIHSSVIKTEVGYSPVQILRVMLSGRVDVDRPGNDGTARDLNTVDEAAFLVDMALTISRRVCSAMSFESAQEALSSIAETMLRVLEFRSRAIVLQQVCLVSSTSASPIPTSDAQCFTTAKWKARAPSEAEKENQTEVEIISEDKKADEDEHTDDRGDCDESHEGIGDGNNSSAQTSHDTHQCSLPVAEASSNQSIDTALQPDHDVESAHAAVARKYSFTPDNFGPREKPYLKMPLHQTPLIIRKGGKESFRCGPVHSERVENHLGFRSFWIHLLWKSQRRSTITEISILDLAQTIEDYLISNTESSLTSFSDAIKTLGTILPESSEVRIDLISYPTHRQDGQEGEFRISSRPNGTAQILLPRVLIEDLDKTLLVGVSLTGTLLATKARGSSALSVLQAINASLEPVLRAILKDDKTKDLQHAARLVASRALRDPKLTAGLMDLQNVRSTIIVSTNGRDQGAVRADISREDAEDAVFVALGSNVGDRVSTIEEAMRVLDGNDNVTLLQTSPLYETDPMYVQDQERFLNGMCKIETQLDPIKLLDTLQAVETNLGRVKLIDKGPRNIDLDIISYKQQVIESDRLLVPHRLMLEREFVLRPLCDLDKNFLHPQTSTTAMKHLRKLPPSSTPMYPLTPLAPGLNLHAMEPLRKTMVMSILNVTPDSFSDGGQHRHADMEALKRTAAAHIVAGARIIDIGGQSSRPNAPDITADEEISRILPAIEAIKSLPEAANVATSIDTYRASVAEAAINAGAHIINDISAGLLDPEMLPTIARLGCTYVMMHMRGTPATMQNEENTSYPKGLVRTIISELKERIKAAEEAGIRRWRIILDPGVGFAKTTDQNLEILRRFEHIRCASGLETYPWLVGSSRKGFIGTITGVENAADRRDGTAATVTAAIQGGAEIVRVHDVEEMVRVVKMADAMYRSLGK